MSKLMAATVTDLRGGRDSWRVLLLVSAPAFTIAVFLTLVQNGF